MTSNDADGNGGGVNADDALGGFPLVTADDAASLAARLADDVAGGLGEALAARGAASLVVSGGSTPRPFLERLARASLDWSRVAVTLADERWVDAGHADSNAALVRATLLVGPAAAARFVALHEDAATPEEGLDAVARRIDAMPRPFDVVVLGMGGDGHTASLFPDAPELEHAMTDTTSPVAAMHPPSVPQARITLTRAALLDSRARFLHVTGADKRDVLERALADEPRLAPIARVLDGAPDGVTIYWAP